MAEREGATVICGSEEGLKYAYTILEENNLPLGLLHIADIIEVGYVRETGYFWVKQTNAVYHTFNKIGRVCFYNIDISGYMTKKHIKNLKGVQAKELFLWPVITQITIIDDHESDSEMVEFKADLMGITKYFPIEAFALDQ